MKRRAFLGSTLAAGAGAFGASCGGDGSPWSRGPGRGAGMPGTLAGTTIENLREDYRHRLFDLYLSFWENGAYDAERGGFMTVTDDNGVPVSTVKTLESQGQALWMYSFLYNNMGEDEEHLGIARKTRDFMITHMRADGGRWYGAVERDGAPAADPGENASAWLQAAHGLSEFAKASKSRDDQEIIFETLWSALRVYDGLNYKGNPDYRGMSPDVSLNGLRELGHSATIIRLLTGYLSHTRNRRLEEVLEDHMTYVMESFFNPRLGVMNAFLKNDYTRIEGYEDYMQTGTALSAAWAVAFEAQRSRNASVFDDAAQMIRRYLEMGWDYVFEGFGDGNFYIFDGPDRTRDSLYSKKTLASHCEIMTAMLHIYEYTGEEWAKIWYERVRAFCLQKFAAVSPVWPLSLDRFGRAEVRRDTRGSERDIFHLPRFLILDLLSLDRMLEKMGKLEDIEAAS